MERRVKKMLQYVEVSEKVAGGGVVFASSASGSGSGSSSGKGLLPPSDSGTPSNSGSGGGSDLIPGEPIYVRYINGIMGGLPMVKRGNEYYFLDGDKLGGLVGAIEPGGVVQVGTVPVVSSGGSNGGSGTNTSGRENQEINSIGTSSPRDSSGRDSGITGGSSDSGGSNQWRPFPNTGFERPVQYAFPDEIVPEQKPTDSPVFRVTSSWGTRWGGFHPGLDIGTSEGTAIEPIAGGVVEEIITDPESSTGLMVTVRHTAPNGGVYYSRYLHLSKINVKAGDVVTHNSVIGESGNTGVSTGPHLHYDIYAYCNSLGALYLNSLLPQNPYSLSYNTHIIDRDRDGKLGSAGDWIFFNPREIVDR